MLTRYEMFFMIVTLFQVNRCLLVGHYCLVINRRFVHNYVCQLLDAICRQISATSDNFLFLFRN